MSKLSDRILNLSDSQTLAMAQRSRDLKEKGVDVINLSIGEPDFGTPQCIKDAGKKAIDDNYSHYSPVPGFNELRKAIVEKFRKENNLEYDFNEIIVSNGAKQSLANVLLSLVNKGEEVIIPTPYWVSYIELVKLAEGVPILLEACIDNDFKITPKQIEQAISAKTKAIMLNSPSNPTGSVYSQEEMEEIAEVLKKYPDIIIISDEIYEHINYVGKHFSIAQIDGMKERTAVINGVSKAYAMTGWRIGYMAAPIWLAKACNKLQGQTTSGANSVAQIAAIEALESGMEESNRMREAFHNRRDLVMSMLDEIPGITRNVPSAAFYIFPNIEGILGKSYGKYLILSDMDLAMYLLETAHVAIVPGSAFGSANCIRISFAASEKELIEAFTRMHQAISLLE
jgi:aspartate aminotransferase